MAWPRSWIFLALLAAIFFVLASTAADAKEAPKAASKGVKRAVGESSAKGELTINQQRNTSGSTFFRHFAYDSLVINATSYCVKETLVGLPKEKQGSKKRSESSSQRQNIFPREAKKR